MSDQWDFYFRRVEDNPASMYVDLGLHEQAPIAALPVMAYVRVRMLQPRPDGLSSRDEFDALVQIEDALSAGLANDSTLYVGRCTTDGSRDFFYYTVAEDGWQARAAEVMRQFPDYEYEAGAQLEPDWSTYLEYLHPSDLDMETINNRHVCEQLEKQGDALSEPREIDPWAYFEDAASRDTFIERAAQQGYQLRDKCDPDGEETERFLAQLWRSDVPQLPRD